MARKRREGGRIRVEGGSLRDDFAQEDPLQEPLLPPSSIVADVGVHRRDNALTAAERSSSGSSSRRNSNNNDKNVTLILWYTWIVFAGRSIWNQTVLTTYVFLLKNDATDPTLSVGIVTAAMGVAQLIVSIPSGWFADRYRRDTLLRCATCVGILAVGCTIGILHSQQKQRSSSHSSSPTTSDASYTALIASLMIWGCYWGIANTSVSALFADSIVDGQRSLYFTRRSILINVGNVTGPIVALSMFLYLGNAWTLHECAIVMSIGQLICLPAVILLLFMKDADDDAGIATSARSNSGVPLSTTEIDIDATNENHEPINDLEDDGDSDDSLLLLLSNTEETESNHTPNAATPPTATGEGEQQHCGNNGNRDETYDAAQLSAWFPCFSEERVIPCLVATADVSAGLAAGMSVRYFAIFLYQNLQFGPVAVQLVYGVTPLLQASLMKAALYYSKSHHSYYGRCTVAVFQKWVGVLLMFCMIGAYQQQMPTFVVTLLLMLRTAFMNSTSALTRSVLMDHVPPSERAKWSALESLNMFSWSGSAVLGGLLVDKKGILFNFTVTGILQLCATLPLVALSLAPKPMSTTNSRGGQRSSSAAATVNHEQSSVNLHDDQESVDTPPP